MRKSDVQGKVHLSLIRDSSEGGHSQSSSDYQFQGLDATTSARHDVKFTIAREAGRFECAGFLENGEGAGVFHFLPNPQFVEQMKALGFTGLDGDKQMAAAIHDVTVEFAREMQAEHITGLDFDKLIAFRIFGVTGQFIKDLRSSGLNVTDSDKLVAFRIHGVAPEMVPPPPGGLHSGRRPVDRDADPWRDARSGSRRSPKWATTHVDLDQLIAFRIHGVSPEFIGKLNDLGYKHLEADQLVAMRIHGATTEWIEALGRVGYDHIEPDQLIAFRIHGVSPEFIGKIQELGYKHPDADQLVAMRIHGVTPEYIAKLQSQGMHDLSADQLINLRIHGID